MVERSRPPSTPPAEGTQKFHPSPEIDRDGCLSVSGEGWDFWGPLANQRCWGHAPHSVVKISLSLLPVL